MGFLFAIQAFFTFSFLSGLANWLITDNMLASFALGAAGFIGVFMLYGMFPRLVSAFFIVAWLGTGHLIVLMIRDVLDVPDTVPLLNGTTASIYFFALVFGVFANLEHLRELMAMKQQQQ